jgi:DNA-binding transcriptional MocR family regulator
MNESNDCHRSRHANLLTWLKKLQDRYHTPIDFSRYDLCVTNGSMEGLSKVFELVLNPDDPILVDSPCYSGSLDFVCNSTRNYTHEVKFNERKVV